MWRALQPSRLIATLAACPALLLCAAPAAADTVGYHLVSAHIPAKDYNNINPGIYYRLDEGVVGGVYRNSFKRASVYVGYTWLYKDFGLTLGAVTGYKNSVQPLLVPTVALYTHRDYTLRLAFIPQVEKRIGSHVLHLVLEH
jgi:hypothetical protein